LHPFKKIKRHPFEPVAEWSIRLIASFSIILIFLIFLFVFREAAGLFTPDAAPEASSGQAPSSESSGASPQQESYGDDLQQESYGDDLQQESYGGDLQQESYGGDLQQESYGGNVAEGEHVLYVPRNPNYPEIYNSETGMLPADIDEIPGEQTPAVVEESPGGLLDNLLGDTWQPVSEQPKFGIWPLVIGTLKTTLIAIALGAPLGILAALYTAFFARRRVREIVKPAIELLAGFPSVVIGFFCLVTVASFLQETFGMEYRLNAIVGGIGLSLAVIPIVYSIAEDALNAVPKTLREASLALGSTEWQTAYRVMLPAAAPGVIAAVILGIGRAFGETMIAIMATGNAPMASWNILTPARTFAATIGSEMGEVVWGSEHYGILFLLGTVLFVVSFGLNALTELYVKKRLIKKFQGH